MSGRGARDERWRHALLNEAPPGHSPQRLLAALLSPGGVERPERLSGRVLRHFGGLRGLAAASPSELLACGELGPGGAARLTACFALGRQAARVVLGKRPAIHAPEDVAALLATDMAGLRQEQFRVLLLDSKHRVEREVLVAMGGLNAAVVHPREVLRPAILSAAAAMVMVHNHPSGDPEPSEEDLRLTARFHDACRLMGIELLDHVILGGAEHVSLRERGLMP
ncbi:MAG: DNA repair protein RadC [Candidatus Krumholzibacteriia bacterium]|nr:DNA repair protein RadC [bacterium]MCB9513297.1 DNA repair protein RadC [Candidatus Latescibacterota bacterium]MCB9514757.1 DNA repair protein RadC [Candidatus Latescibacterota bacterium]